MASVEATAKYKVEGKSTRPKLIGNGTAMTLARTHILQYTDGACSMGRD